MLRNIYYVHCEVEKEPKAVNSVPVKRGKEWHGADGAGQSGVARFGFSSGG